VTVDFVADFPIPERLREPLQATLRGEAAEWPRDLTPLEIRTLAEHGVGPLVYANARVPALRTEAIRAAALEPLRALDLTEVLRALAARGVATLVMKGSALAYDVYAAPELRPRGDTDLLIAPADLPKARAVFRDLGCDELPSSRDEHGLRQATFTRPPAMMYDLHWSFTNVPLFDSVLRFEELYARAIALPLLGNDARALSRVDALLVACIHRVAHHHDSDRLIWLVDIALLRERMSGDEHRLFWRLAAEGRVTGVCARSIELADAWLSHTRHDLAEESLSPAELAREEPSRVFLNKSITHAGVLMASLRALPWRARAKRLWQVAFPPGDFMRSSFGTRSRAMLPLLYAYRGLRGALRLFRRVSP
jgi:hypothetical protein